MLTEILYYIGEDYSNIRTLCGLNEEELTDTELSLTIYKDYLALALNETSGIYSPSLVEQTLDEMFDTLNETDPMRSAIGLFSIYTVADCVMGSIGLRAYKTMADGKATLTRFSAESSYQESRKHVQDMLRRYLSAIKEMLEVDIEDVPEITAVAPTIDPVTGS